MLRELHSSIGMLEDAEKLRQQTEKELIAKKHGGGLGALGSWASGGGTRTKSPEQQLAEAKAEQIQLHRDAVVWYLRKRLELCLETQQHMMETRLSAELNHNMAQQAAPSLADFADYTPRRSQSALNDDPGTSSSVIDSGLSAEQLQMFEEDNQDMVTNFDSALEKVKYVKNFPNSPSPRNLCSHWTGLSRNRCARYRSFTGFS